MHRRSLLKNLLRPLLSEWSREEIIHAVGEVAEEDRDNSNTTRELKVSSRRKPSSKPSALQLAQKADAPDDLKPLIVNLAKRYDDKNFLPNIGDVRHFLEMTGKDSSNVKQRPEAFRRILRSLLETPDEHLRKIVDQNLYSGPSDLRPLAEAIRQTGLNLRKTPAKE